MILSWQVLFLWGKSVFVEFNGMVRVILNMNCRSAVRLYRSLGIGPWQLTQIVDKMAFVHVLWDKLVVVGGV